MKVESLLLCSQEPSNGHCIQLRNTGILVRNPGPMDHIVRETIETDLQPNDMRKGGFPLNKALKLFIHTEQSTRRSVITSAEGPYKCLPLLLQFFILFPRLTLS